MRGTPPALSSIGGEEVREIFLIFGFFLVLFGVMSLAPDIYQASNQTTEGLSIEEQAFVKAIPVIVVLGSIALALVVFIGNG